MPRYRFVGGKGGVGKTTCSAALGVAAADTGRRTLLISTDPAPSLGDALGQRLGPEPSRVRGAAGLWALEIDAAGALGRWIDQRRAALEGIALRGTWLDRDDVDSLLRLSLPGIDEIAALFEIVERGDDPRFEHIVVDTAPTGHLLRMFDMPRVLAGIARVFDRMQAKHRVMVDALRGRWTPDAADALIEDMAAQAARLRALLRDAAAAGLCWVTLPEPMAVEETADALSSLRQQEIAVDGVIVNRLTAPPPEPCAWCRGRRREERAAVDALTRLNAVRGLPVRALEALEPEPRGLPALRAAGRLLRRRRDARTRTLPATPRPVRSVPPRQATGGGPVPLHRLGRALLMFGGKGGVGKTTCAAAAAVSLAAASPGRRVLLLSVDPAHSLGDVLGARVGDAARRLRGAPANLAFRELDAARAFDAIRARFDMGLEQLFDALGASGSVDIGHDRAVMGDLFDLAPPGLDEIAAIIEVTDALRPEDGEAAVDLLVMDTAPTGHALRLLEMPELVHDWVKALMAILLKYQAVVALGELGSVLLRLSKGLGRLRALAADPDRTQFVVVTRAAALPRLETLRLLRRLATAGVRVPALIVNAAGTGTCSRCARDRAAQEHEIALLQGAAARTGHGHIPTWISPARMPPPAGVDALLHWAGAWTAAAAGGRSASVTAPTGPEGARAARQRRR